MYSRRRADETTLRRDAYVVGTARHTRYRTGDAAGRRSRNERRGGDAVVAPTPLMVTIWIGVFYRLRVIFERLKKLQPSSCDAYGVENLIPKFYSAYRYSRVIFNCLLFKAKFRTTLRYVIF